MTRYSTNNHHEIEAEQPPETVAANDIRRRLEIVLGNESNRRIAERTGCNTETVRRYRATGRAKALFIASVAVNYGVNADWLLTGRGTQSVTAPDKESIAKILRTIASTIELDLN